MRLTEQNGQRGGLIGAFIRSAGYERRFLAKNPWDLSMVVWIPLATVLLIWWIFFTNTNHRFTYWRRG